MRTIRSYNDAYEVASEITERLKVGQTVGAGAITFRKQEDGRLAINNSEFNYELGNGINVEVAMYSCEAADFVIFRDRKQINDALSVLERQFDQYERELFDRLA